MIGYLGISCMLSLYAIQMLVENLNMLLMLYYKYILGYIVFSMLVSFVICYRYGPVTNPKSINLIKWTLQVITNFFCYFSSPLVLPNYLGLTTLVLDLHLFYLSHQLRTHQQPSITLKHIQPSVLVFLFFIQRSFS